MSQVTAIIEANRDRFLAEFRELLRFPSESTHAEGLSGAAAWVSDRLRVLGAQPQSLSADGGPPAIFGEVGAGRGLCSAIRTTTSNRPTPWSSGNRRPMRRPYAMASSTPAARPTTRATRWRASRRSRYTAAYGELPLRLKFFVEGEEEVGSPHLAPIAKRHAELLHADGAIWEGGGFDDAERYTFYCGVKGIAYFELRLHGAAYDLHSGYAPIAPNPAWRLIHALSTLKDERDNITVDGLMDFVRPPTAAERDIIRRIPFDGAKMKANWGIRAFLNDMSDEEALTRFVAAPTCTICGLRSGFIDEGEKTVLPSTAMVKLDFRLVPDLTPELVARLLREHLDRRGYGDVEINSFVGMIGARSDMNAPLVQTAIAAARDIYGHEPVVYPSHGGSGPMYDLVQGVGTPAGIIAGVCYPGMRMHAPNENIRLADYFRHIEFLVEFMRRFAA